MIERASYGATFDWILAELGGVYVGSNQVVCGSRVGTAIDGVDTAAVVAGRCQRVVRSGRVYTASLSIKTTPQGACIADKWIRLRTARQNRRQQHTQNSAVRRHICMRGVDIVYCLTQASIGHNRA